ncbi:hypothetical protein C8F01DRAFT_1180092 [Mycena amicta]|nr:hypothetical protein C8F01DRAFT_1180092 [Mycena amicta]
MHLPSIHHCVMQYWTDATARFLDGHPQLRTLRVTRIPVGVIPAEKCSLPLLEEFGGPDTVATTVLGDAKRLRRLWITKTSMPVAKLFDSIDAGRHPLDSELIEVSFHINNWDLTLPSAIRQHTPNILSLQIECENDHDSYTVGLEDFISLIDDALLFLPNLFHLGIAHPVCISDDDDPGVFQKLDQQLDLECHWVQRWGDRAPSLGLCTLPSCTEWWRFSQKIWNPAPMSDNKNDILNRVDWAWTRRTAEELTLAMVAGVGRLEEVKQGKSEFSRRLAEFKAFSRQWRNVNFKLFG